MSVNDIVVCFFGDGRMQCGLLRLQLIIQYLPPL